MTDVHDRDADVAIAQQALSRVDSPLDRRRVGDMRVDKWAGLTFAEYREAIEFAKLMCQSNHMIPPYLKGSAADCCGIITQALRWRLEPYWVAQHSYVARAESMVTYDAAVHAAILLSSGLLRGRPRYIFNGEGEERTCTVSAVFHGEHEPQEYTTPPLKQCRPKRNERGEVKGSPLWDKDPDQALGYFAIRNFGRRHAPEVLGGVYDREEFDETTQDVIEPPASPNLMDRLPGKIAGAGFKLDIVDTGVAEEATKVEEAAKPKRQPKARPLNIMGRAAQAASEVSPEPSVEQPPEPETHVAAPEPAQQPTKAEEYLGWVERWVAKVTDPDDLEARWEGERELRDSLKVPIAVRRRAEAIIRARVEDLRK